MRHGKENVFLHPGEFRFGNSDLHLHTLLGSCVSITLWHPHLQIGGMCHFVLPKRCQRHVADAKSPDGRYGEEAMQLFMRAADEHHTSIHEYRAKVFGGSNMLGWASQKDNHIGAKNAATAFKLLALSGAEIAFAHVGDTCHRRLMFDVESGEVWMRHKALIEGDSLFLKRANGLG